ncbi:MAG: hypothetical protein AVDCRST_MAG73-234 [uncultured Thermomicrobiales bacterium]|uniref:Uncharacterized protein n=1 Tax=uncultured Thermomicrobiales bacterium TaxID=1645740 RepID=A0A6J4TFE5_9BACT|nr:MAG: hypothetical protein AVDCRST_MAG73-234 [uncultured Thermomicrobiales bacterium]
MGVAAPRITRYSGAHEDLRGHHHHHHHHCRDLDYRDYDYRACRSGGERVRRPGSQRTPRRTGRREANRPPFFCVRGAPTAFRDRQ